MNIRRSAIILIIFATGCASAPIVTNPATLAENPLQFKNRRIEITGPVLENYAPGGDEYRTWTFFMGLSGNSRIMLSEEGFNPSTIEKAYQLVEEARREGDEITVTGRLRVGPYEEFKSGKVIELDSVRYRDVEINTDMGPYVGDYYPYYYHYYPPPYWYYRHHSYYYYYPYYYWY
jgi:hypothetical protein